MSCGLVPQVEESWSGELAFCGGGVAEIVAQIEWPYEQADTKVGFKSWQR